MPYIKKQKRQLYDELIIKLADIMTESVCSDGDFFKGHFNYIIFKLAKEIERSHQDYDNVKFGYQDYSDVVGAMRDCADEYVRRVLAPYEDEKILQNGDI